jgi:hypothetical protein
MRRYFVSALRVQFHNAPRGFDPHFFPRSFIIFTELLIAAESRRIFRADEESVNNNLLHVIATQIATIHESID